MVKLILLSLLAYLALVNGYVIKSNKMEIMGTQGGEDPDPEIRERRNFVKAMMKDAWDDYARYAWGENELKPISQVGQPGGIYGDSKIGATIIDALSTLHIMEFNEEFDAGRAWVASDFDFTTVNTTVSVFETNIRILGGFLSAYAFTGDELFKDKAYEVGKQLLPVFDTPSGIPYQRINPATGQTDRSASNSLAEFGTLHLEFIYLSEVTGDPIFAEKVLKIQDVMDKLEKPNGLYSMYVSTSTGQFTDSHVSMGGGADSFYEYLIKAYVQNGDLVARRLYDETIDAYVQNNLIQVSHPSSLIYIAELFDGSRIEHIGSHLECFAGGMFALGSATDPRNSSQGGQQARDFEIGRNFTNTCHESYVRATSKIGPEVFHFTEDAEAVAVYDGEKAYILRPEVLESYFVLYRLTNNTMYRDWAWEAAQQIEKLCKAGPGRGYSGLRNVYDETPQQDDVQQTFFLAETLKYLYLIFSTPDLISLDSWVFNTECHPLPVKGTHPLYQ